MMNKRLPEGHTRTKDLIPAAESIEDNDTTVQSDSTGCENNSSCNPNAPAITQSPDSRSAQPGEAARVKAQQDAERKKIEVEVFTFKLADGTEQTLTIFSDFSNANTATVATIRDIKAIKGELISYSHGHGLGGKRVEGDTLLDVAFPPVEASPYVQYTKLPGGGYRMHILKGGSVLFCDEPSFKQDYKVYRWIHKQFPNAKLYITAPGVEWRYVYNKTTWGHFEQLSK